MKKTFKLLAVIFVLGFGLVWSNAFADKLAPFFPPQSIGEGGTVCGYFSPAKWDTVGAGWLIGHKVSSPLGGNLGQISDLMIDRSDGHIALVILSDVPGFGTGFVAAPFSALERIGENVFQLSLGDRDIQVTDTYTDPYAYELERYESTVGLSTIPQSIDSSRLDAVYRFYGRTPYWSADKEPQIMSYRAVTGGLSIAALSGKETAPVLMGSMVQSSDGKATGRIEDMVVDIEDGLVVLLALDKVPGKGDASVAVPFMELSMSGNAFVVNTTEDKLAAAPNFNEDTDLHNPRWAADDYTFFGMQPCWKE